MELNFALHETLDLHEVAAFKAVCATKSKTMQALVADADLQDLLRADADVSSRQLHELSELLSRATKGDRP